MMPDFLKFAILMKPERKVILLNIPHPVLQSELESRGFTCHHEDQRPKEEVEDMIGAYEGLIINSRFRIDRTFIDKAVNLRFIGRLGSGMEGIDVEYASTKGIRCFSAPEGNRDAVGEHALGMLLALFNNMVTADRQVRQGIWKREENRGLELNGKTVGIIGYGNTGSAFAQRLNGFGATVLAYDKYKTGFSENMVKESSQEELFEHADVLSLHIPLTEETQYMVNDAFIAGFSKPFWLINTSRGKVVETAALVRALQQKKIYGAALDVLEYEDISAEKLQTGAYPEPFRYLLTCENVILTPHVAGWTAESTYKLAKVLAEKIIAALGT
jgi:D-3-phosphoglycerate dehydrogenase / 2-oxoglutarate reductase